MACHNFLCTMLVILLPFVNKSYFCRGQAAPSLSRRYRKLAVALKSIDVKSENSFHAICVIYNILFTELLCNVSHSKHPDVTKYVLGKTFWLLFLFFVTICMKIVLKTMHNNIPLHQQLSLAKFGCQVPRAHQGKLLTQSYSDQERVNLLRYPRN